MIPGVVFDCMVYLQAVISERSPAFACFTLVENGQVMLHTSEAILAEVQDVLLRPALRSKFRTLTPDLVHAFLGKITTIARLAVDVPRIYSHSRDPKDEPYINLALATKSSYLVSRDKDLLDLMADTAFCTSHPTLTVLDPVAFLRSIRASSPSQKEEKASESS